MAYLDFGKKRIMTLWNYVSGSAMAILSAPLHIGNDFSDFVFPKPIPIRVRKNRNSIT